MKNVILLSGPDKRKYFNKNISEEIKKAKSKASNLVVIPADPTNYEKNDKQFNGNETVKGVINCFKKIFPNLTNCVLLDNRINKEKGTQFLKSADIIYLLGGDPFKQIDYLKTNEFDNIIHNSKALIIGVSAGSMNLAIEAYYSKDEDYPKSIFYKGLGIVNITIDPHFDINNSEQVNEIKLNSKDKKIIGLPNESAIIISDNKIKYIGRKYIFDNGKLEN